MKKYVVQPGRTRAIGRKAKPGDIIGPISDTEAEYDLNQGNIAPEKAAPAPRSTAAPAAPAQSASRGD